MKNSPKTKTFDYSPIALRALSRHAFAPPVKRFKHKKRHASKTFCRERDNN